MRRMESPNIPVIKYHPSTLGMQRHRGIWCLPSTPSFLLDSVTEFEMKPTDVVVVSYPKGGVRWLAEAVWLVHNRGNTAKANDSMLETRVPFLEHRNTRLPDPLSLISSRDSPRLMMTHLASYFFDQQLEHRKPKVVMVLRDPRDTLVAQYEWYKSNPYFSYLGNWDDFFNLFHSKLLTEGDWFDHTLSWWELKDEPNILILKYEEVQRDPVKAVDTIARHCGQKLTAQQCDNIAQTVAKTLQEDDYAGKWKKVFSQSQADTISRLFRSYFQGSGLSFRGSGSNGGSPRSGSPKTVSHPNLDKLKLPSRSKEQERRSRSPGRLTGSPDISKRSPTPSSSFDASKPSRSPVPTQRSSTPSSSSKNNSSRRVQASESHRPPPSPIVSHRHSAPSRQDSKSSTSSTSSTHSSHGTQTTPALTQPIGPISVV